METLGALPHVLIIDDDCNLLEAYKVLLETDFQVTTASSGEAGLALLQTEDVAVILLDIRLPGMDGFAVLQQLQTMQTPVEVLMLTALNDAHLAVAALHNGASNYLVKPVDNDLLVAHLRQAVARQRARQNARLVPVQSPSPVPPRLVVGISPVMQALLAQVRRVAATDTTVLLTGETGVGKELVARAVHVHSPRRDHPFVAVNCAALTATLVASELFGHERGAFTGAQRLHVGKIEQAHRGTLFLDEVGGLPLPAQAALLRFLQERTVERVGGEQSQRVDVRVVAATNQELQPHVATGIFRADLFYRLNVVPLHVPPLRARPEDIPLLLQHFLHRYSAAYGRPVPRLTAPALAALRECPWPGNVRELEYLVARLVAISEQQVLDVEEVLTALDSSIEGDRACHSVRFSGTEGLRN